MYALNSWWGHLLDLVAQGLHAWWKVLAQLIMLTVGGWLILQLTIFFPAPMQAEHAWLSIFIFSTGLVVRLSFLVIAIRVAAQAAGIWEKLPANAVKIGRDEPLHRVLSLALLPFVGIYAVFGGIQDASHNLYVWGVLESSTLSMETAASVLTPTTTRERLVMFAILIASLVLGNFVDWLNDRFNKSIFGILGALFQGFFSVVLIFGGASLIKYAVSELGTRRVWQWFTDAGANVQGFFSQATAWIPEVVKDAVTTVFGDIWVLVGDALLEPLLWLAAASMVFGAFTISVADLWTKLDSSDFLSRRNARLAQIEYASRNVSDNTRKAIINFQAALLSDFEEQVLPFIQSLRHVLKRGLPFLGAYLVAYALACGVEAGIGRLLHLLVGGRGWYIWFGLDATQMMATQLIGEPIRLALLAAGLVATLNERPKRELPARNRATGSIILVVVCVLFSGVVGHWVKNYSDYEQVTGKIGEPVSFSPFQTMKIDSVTGSKSVVPVLSGQEPMTTKDVFIDVVMSLETTKRAEIRSINCQLITNDKDTLSNAAYDNGANFPSAWFTTRDVRYVFERPADDLVGAEITCWPSGMYSSYEKQITINLGIDETAAARLANPQNAPIMATEPVVEGQ